MCESVLTSVYYFMLVRETGDASCHEERAHDIFTGSAYFCFLNKHTKSLLCVL
jgi:hypothetical protein